MHDNIARSEHNVSTAIRRALLRDDRVAAAPIDIHVEPRTIRLRGTVHSFRRKLAAQLIARSRAEGRHIVNELRVQPALAPDELIADGLRQELARLDGMPSHSIVVSVDNGRIVLSGHVQSEAQRTIAQDLALAAPGVHSVDNLIMIDMARSALDTTLAMELESQLRQARRLRATDLHVSVNGLELVLWGHTKTRRERRLAGAIVRRFRGWMFRNEVAVRRTATDKEKPHENA